MAIKSGFFNSVNGDRKYDAKRFAEYFASFIGNGIFPSPSTNLQVISNNDMTVTVKAGTAWINGYICINEDNYILEITPADGVLNRIDRVVLRWDAIDREIRLEVKQGDYATNAVVKELQRDADAYELGLADIVVNAGVISITQANITDLRFSNDYCGIVHGTVDQVDTTTLFSQYQDWYISNTTQAESDIANIKQQFENDLIQFNQDWNDWFSQQQLEGFVLQTEKGQPSGIATLGSDGKVLSTQLPAIEVSVTSVNNKTGDVTLDANNVGAASSQEFETHLAENASTSNKGHVQLSSSVTSTSTATAATSSAIKTLADRVGTLPSLSTTNKTNLVNAVNEIFTNVSNGKTLVGGAITDVDSSVVIPTDPTFQQLANSIGNINTGKKWASGSGSTSNQVVVSNLSFTPTFVAVTVDATRGSSGVGENYYIYKIKSHTTPLNKRLAYHEETRHIQSNGYLTSHGIGYVNVEFDTNGFAFFPVSGGYTSCSYSWIAFE